MTLIVNHFEVQRPAFVGGVTEPDLLIVGESPADIEARENLLDEAFGAARFDKTVERLRRGRLPAPGLALVAKDSGELVGTLRMWNIHAGKVPALLLGPLAVAKAERSRGIGRKLMAEALFRAFSAGHNAILLVGDAPYYEPFGFAGRHTRGLILPGPVDKARFLGLELRNGALTEAKGRVTASGALDLSAHRGGRLYRRAA